MNLNDDEIYDLYVNKGLKVLEIAKLFHTRTTNISSILKKFGILPIKNRGKIFRNTIEDYFENIDNEYKAYFLGFITADGSITKRKDREDSYTLRIEIKESDYYLLDIFRKEIGYEGKISKINRDSVCYKISINSQKMTHDLMNYGVVPNKTYLMNRIYKNFSNSELFRHYLRGIFDGDGCITKLKNKNYYMANITEYSEDLIYDYSSTINNFLGLKNNKIIYTGSAFRYSWNGEKAILLHDFLYKNSNIYLERKKYFIV